MARVLHSCTSSCLFRNLSSSATQAPAPSGRPQVAPVHEVRKTDTRLHDHERTGGKPGFVRLF